MFKGTATAVAAASPHSLWREDLATFGEGGSYRQSDSAGFIRLYGLPLRVAAQVQRGL